MLLKLICSYISFKLSGIFFELGSGGFGLGSHFLFEFSLSSILDFLESLMLNGGSVSSLLFGDVIGFSSSSYFSGNLQ